MTRFPLTEEEQALLRDCATAARCAAGCQMSRVDLMVRLLDGGGLECALRRGVQAWRRRSADAGAGLLALFPATWDAGAAVARHRWLMAALGDDL